MCDIETHCSPYSCHFAPFQGRGIILTIGELNEDDNDRERGVTETGL